VLLDVFVCVALEVCRELVGLRQILLEVGSEGGMMTRDTAKAAYSS
jgi:hypothetical protein